MIQGRELGSLVILRREDLESGVILEGNQFVRCIREGATRWGILTEAGRSVLSSWTSEGREASGHILLCKEGYMVL